MSQQITIQVSDRVARHAARLAAKTQRRVEDVLADWLETVHQEKPVAELDDEEVLGLTEVRLSDDQEAALGELLEHNREGRLDQAGRRRLDELMHSYERGLLRKAQALQAAVQRGLLEPLQS